MEGWGDSRPPRAWTPGRRGGLWERLRPRTLPAALAGSVIVGLAGALAWAVVRGILEFPGALVVAVLAGWTMGVLHWQVRASPLIPAALAALAWLAGLILTWLVSMAILPGSSRTFVERLDGTPFLEWLAPQFGALEAAGLVLYVVGALYGARPRR